ncbi:MAG TPA: nitroreductase [Casimicrobiaceae bacterium]|nr:nitroreductase [Casimicrobiaceae bacterium]
MFRELPTPSNVPPEGAAVARALLSRRSVRGFLPTPVPRDVVESILHLAARAPSGTNVQPWKVYACTGAIRDALARDILALHDAGGAGHVKEYSYYPKTWREPFLARRRKLGWDYYKTVGVTRQDKPGMHRQHGRNFEFFGAPVGLFFTMARDLELGSWLDTGMFVQGVMIAARAFDLHTCPQAAFIDYHAVVRRHLAIPDDEILLCGMSLGVIDREAPENTLVTEREPVSAFATLLGW